MLGALLLAAPLTAQQPTAAEYLARYAAEQASEATETPAGGVLISIMRLERPWTVADRTEVERGLRAMISTAPTERARWRAALLFASGGNRDNPKPAPGRVAELRAIHEASQDPGVRHMIVSAMREQAEQDAAVAWLETLATTRPGPLESDAPAHAVLVLNGIGPKGRAALRRLAEEGRVTDPDAKALLAQMFAPGSPFVPRE